MEINLDIVEFQYDIEGISEVALELNEPVLSLNSDAAVFNLEVGDPSIHLNLNLGIPGPPGPKNLFIGPIEDLPNVDELGYPVFSVIVNEEEGQLDFSLVVFVPDAGI